MKKELDRFFWNELCWVKHDYLMLEGDLAQEIVRCSAAESFDLIIVMPTLGYVPFRRSLVSSVTAKVLHDAGCPVMTGQHMEQAPQPAETGFSSVLCAVDLKDSTRTVLSTARDCADSYGALLRIIHTVCLGDSHVGRAYFDLEWWQEAVDAARERIFDLCDHQETSGGVNIPLSEPPAAVHDEGTRLAANLVIIGRSHAMVVTGRLRANGYAIVREAPCAVVRV